MPINIDKSAKKKNGLSRYRVRVNYTDTSGENRQVERLVWGKAEAEAMERELEAEYKVKRTVLPKRMTVAELVKNYSEYHSTETRQTSHEAAMKELRLRVLPHLKDQKIANLNQVVLANWKITIDQQDLALRTKQNAYKAFAALLNYAVKMEYIPKNYLSVLGNFRDTMALEKPPEEIRYYTAEQFEKFIAAAKECCKTVMDWDFYVFFCIAFFTGARKGEIHAMKWSDIDGNILHIRRSISQKIKGVSDLEAGTKNKTSTRDLQLPTPLIEVLNEHKKRQQEAAPNQFSETYRICGGERPLRDTSIENHNQMYGNKAGLPHITIHEFRHSHVSLLANKGINIQEVSRRLGHANVQETWNTYCHLYPREEERAVEVLNEIQI